MAAKTDAMRALSDSTAAGSLRRTPLAAITGPRSALAAVGAAGVALSLVTVPDEPPGYAIAHILGVTIPVGFGLFRLVREPEDAFARQLVLAAAMWSLTTLAVSSNSAAYSIGRVSAWVIEPIIVFLLLAFPHGRIETRTDRRLVTAAVILAATLFVPTALFAPFPEPTPWSACTAGCPNNAFQISTSATGFVHDVIQPLREVLSTVVFALVAARLFRRRKNEGAVLSRVLTPVAWVAAIRVIALGAFYAARSTNHLSWLTHVFGWLFMASLLMVTAAFAAGILAERLFVADALERLARRLSSRPTAPELRDVLADALHDPELAMRFHVPESDGRWVEENGWPAAPPIASTSRATTQVRADGRVLAAIMHDRELMHDPALLAGISSFTATALENRELVGRLQSSLRELTESRARLVSVADEERRRIERNLHDGAQQRLVALQIKLALLADQVEGESPGEAAQLHSLETELEATLDEVRRLGHGLYPALLADRGLSDALHAVARTAPVPTTIDVQLPRRYPQDVESAVYFACVEALQNVGKHARGATSVTISVKGNDHLEFEVRDNGSGFDDRRVSGGVGITNMRDRIRALRGKVVISSRPGNGTRLTGSVPLS